MKNRVAKIYVVGHRGMVGSAIVRQLLQGGYPASNILTRTHAELDLANQAAGRSLFEAGKPEQVYLAAAKVGGLYANNTYPADFIYQNLMIQANVIDEASHNCSKKLFFMIELHLPQASFPTYGRRCTTYWSHRAH